MPKKLLQKPYPDSLVQHIDDNAENYVESITSVHLVGDKLEVKYKTEPDTRTNPITGRWETLSAKSYTETLPLPDVDLQVEEFPNCCGIDILTSFPDKLDPVLPAAIEKGINTEVGMSRVGLMLIALSSEQPEAIEAAQAAGFTEYTDFENPNSHNRIKLFGKVINQPVARKKPARRVGTPRKS